MQQFAKIMSSKEDYNDLTAYGFGYEKTIDDRFGAEDDRSDGSSDKRLGTIVQMERQKETKDDEKRRVLSATSAESERALKKYDKYKFVRYIIRVHPWWKERFNQDVCKGIYGRRGKMVKPLKRCKEDADGK